ncbi:uncharacterized protein LOC106168567 [Lingula anatina]|uniref:Uncharacterized protein LOC106168567 n=1 Tax=Lingula anatina TaxID=7574 RepID=A0A1S3J009_LINAN|nr:uncharacterized protein LOC106168567 [Lingula anatina]|eukprot:XP_013403139.1 uncharacterized protein LOC106168567 [Lingula anatina]
MAARCGGVLVGQICIVLTLLVLCTQAQQCQFPSGFLGDWYSKENGEDTDTVIDGTAFQINSREYGGPCIASRRYNETTTHEQNNKLKVLIRNSRGGNNCYMCLELYLRTPNILQQRSASSCRSSPIAPSLEDVCNAIRPQAGLVTMFRKSAINVNCRTTFEGVFQFTYEYDVGGGGICNSPSSIITACQLPGSVYYDNQAFDMVYAVCPGLSMSKDDTIRYQCLGSWLDDNGNIFAAVMNTGEDRPYRRFRCMLTRKEQQRGNNEVRWTMSESAECSTLKSPYEGPIRLLLTPVVGSTQLREITPSCNLPRNFSGTWFTTGEYDSTVTINYTHIYFKTKIDQFTTRETYFTCQQTQQSSYMMTSVTRGRCEVDYVCFDFLPRHHNIIRYRLGKPFRLSRQEKEQPVEDYLVTKFRQACARPSYVLNEQNYNWKYNTFILYDPSPIECPIQGRYTFKQFGAEKYVTRIRGITERPRVQVDCRDYESEIAICHSRDSKVIEVDAERCRTLDQNARPVGEYDVPDNLLTCVGYWLEDNRSYMVTYDEEDRISRFRCWVYERLTWRDIIMSRAVRAACGVAQTPRSFRASEGASLSIQMFLDEREHDDCPQKFDFGANPWLKENVIYVLGGSITFHGSYILVLCLAFLSLLFAC